MSTEKFTFLFGVLREPVIIAQNGDIIYRNPAALRIAELADAPLSAIVPQFVTDNATSSFLTETELAAVRYRVSGTELEDGVTAFVLAPENEAEPTRNTDVIASSTLAIREPLAILKHASEFVLPVVEGLQDPKLSEYASLMHSGVFSVMRALNRLDAFVHLRSGANSLPRGSTHFDLVRACSDLVDTVCLMLELKPERLRFSSRLRVKTVVGERQLIERMLLCLVNNALVHTADDAQIVVSVRETEEHAVIVVTDNGCGIAEDVRDDVWTRYGNWRELDDTRRGVGFGFTVVQSIAKLHGGGTLIESLPGEGTSVIVSIDAGLRIVGVSDELVPYGTVMSMTEIFTELVDLIPSRKFSQKYLD